MSSGVFKCQERAWNRPGKGKNVGEKQLRMKQKRNKRMGTNIYIGIHSSFIRSSPYFPRNR